MDLRRAKIETFLEQYGAKSDMVSIEHITKWNPHTKVRTPTPISIVELSCRSVRENVLAKIGQSKLEDGKGGTCDIQRAKTSFQRKRNDALTRLCDKLKLDQKCAGKTVEIAWKIEGTKDRGVKVDGAVIFLQSPLDAAGQFKAPFQDMSL